MNFLKDKIEIANESPSPGKNGSKWKRLENMFRKKSIKPILKKKLPAVIEEESIQKPLNSNADAVATNSTAEQQGNKMFLQSGLQLGSEADQNEFGLRNIDITVSKNRKNKKGILRATSMLPRRTESIEIFQ